MELIKKLRNKLLNEHLMFAYRGEVTGDNSVALLLLLEKEMELSEFSLLGRKRLFMFVLENLQNITRHGSTERDEVTSLVVYNKTADGYTVSTGNVLKKREVKGLRQNLEKINSLDPESIREVYKAMLQDSNIGHKGGAGLGLIEMARKTGNKLDYDFLPIDESYSYFILSKTVDAGGHGINRPETDTPFNGQKIAQLEHMMKSNNIYFLWAGVMSHAISKELLNFSETTMLEAEVKRTASTQQGSAPLRLRRRRRRSRECSRDGASGRRLPRPSLPGRKLGEQYFGGEEGARLDPRVGRGALPPSRPREPTPPPSPPQGGPTPEEQAPPARCRDPRVPRGDHGGGCGSGALPDGPGCTRHGKRSSSTSFTTSSRELDRGLPY